MLRQRQKVRKRVEQTESGGRMSADDRRQHLIQVAIRLFSQKGYSGTTTREIAIAAGVNEAIIFRHFSTKDELYAAILDSKARESPLDDLLDNLRRFEPARDDEGMFRYLASKILQHHREDHDFLRLMLYSALENHELARKFLDAQSGPLDDFLSNYVAIRQREGAFRPCDPGMAVQSFIGMAANYTLVQGLFGLGIKNVSDEEAVDTFTDLMLQGLCVGASESKSNGEGRVPKTQAKKQVVRKQTLKKKLRKKQ